MGDQRGQGNLLGRQPEKTETLEEWLWVWNCESSGLHQGP